MAVEMFGKNILSKFSQPAFNVFRSYAKSIKIEIKPKKAVVPAKDYVSYEQSSSQIDGFKRSLQARGFLRKEKAYTPPSDVQERLVEISKLCFPESWSWKRKIDDVNTKFKLLSLCWKEFGHQVPNSMLAAMDTLDDICDYYQTEVKNITPLEALKDMELPPNLHVQYDYHRFHPETDTLFGGVSAYPGSSTIVSSIKYKKKYKGYVAPREPSAG